MNKFLIVKNFIIASKKSNNIVVDENTKLRREIEEKDNIINDLKAIINSKNDELNNTKVKYGATGALLGFGVGKL